jgi:dCMP deaminase
MLGPREVIDWDSYFFKMCEVISLRSKDPATQHGAILVDENNRVISTGYNGGCRKIDDSKINWDRPEKYHFVIHAEENALWTAEKKNLEGCTLYVTGPPCSRCMLRIAHSGVSRVVYGEKTSKCVDQMDWKISTEIARLADMRLESCKGGDLITFCSQSNGRT